ncbi:TSUP family transporter [Providencia sp. Me31A]|uniref:TSUP family transporter n=1 Tax=Providencia sp. Me31A TaxID=3392637 RepID=UPI003D2CA861
MDWLTTVAPEVYAVLFFVALFAGFIDSIAGGGGLLTIPALLSVGITPVEALATNKLQALGGSFSSTLYFVRRKTIDLREQIFPFIMTMIGSMLGAIVIQLIDTAFLKQLLPALVICVGLYFLLTPSIGAQDRQQRISMPFFGVAIGMTLGFYDGVFGPGTGSFLALGYVLLLGYNLAKATAHAKLLNFASNFGSLVFFIIGGHVLWVLGLVMLIGQMAGARLGARLVLTKGQKLIRPMIVVISLLMSIKLLHDSHGDVIKAWFLSLF